MSVTPYKALTESKETQIIQIIEVGENAKIGFKKQLS